MSKQRLTCSTVQCRGHVERLSRDRLCFPGKKRRTDLESAQPSSSLHATLLPRDLLLPVHISYEPAVLAKSSLFGEKPLDLPL